MSASSDSSSDDNEELEQLSSDEEREANTTKTASPRQGAKPTLQLPSGFSWDMGVVKNDDVIANATSSESEEDDRDEKEEVSSVNK